MYGGVNPLHLIIGGTIIVSISMSMLGVRVRVGGRVHVAVHVPICEVHLFGHFCIPTSRNTEGAVLEFK